MATQKNDNDNKQPDNDTNIAVVPPSEAPPRVVVDRSRTILEKGEGESGEPQVQRKVDAEQAAGFVGKKVDPVPNEAYTVAGVTTDDPTLTKVE